MQIHRSFNRAPSGVVRLVRRARCARSTGRPAGSARPSVRPASPSSETSVADFRPKEPYAGTAVGSTVGRSARGERTEERESEREEYFLESVVVREREREEASRQECVVVSAQTPADEQQTGRKASSLRGRERTNER